MPTLSAPGEEAVDAPEEDDEMGDLGLSLPLSVLTRSESLPGDLSPSLSQMLVLGMGKDNGL